MLHEEAMPGMRRCLRIIRALAVIEGPKREHVAAVVHVVEQHAVALRRIDRLQQKEVRPALDHAACIARSPLEVADAFVGLVCRVGLDEHPAFEAFEGTCGAKCLACGKRRALGDLNASDFRLRQSAQTSGDDEVAKAEGHGAV